VACEGKRDPAERVGEVRAVVIGMCRPGGRQPEHDRERGASHGGQAKGKPRQRSEPDGDLRDGDEQAHRDRERLDHVHERGQRRDAREGRQLGDDRRGRGRVEEGRIQQLVEAGVEECRPEEQAEWQERASRHARALHLLHETRSGSRFGGPGTGSRRRFHVAGRPGTSTLRLTIPASHRRFTLRTAANRSSILRAPRSNALLVTIRGRVQGRMCPT